MVILVVDTVSLVRSNLDRLLTANGHEVLTADTGKAAVEILKNDQRISLVVTDLHVAGMTAVDLFKATRNIERVGDGGNSSPPEFILFTSLRPDGGMNNTDVQLLHETAALGFIDVLFKPLVRGQLLQHVGTVKGGPTPK